MDLKDVINRINKLRQDLSDLQPLAPEQQEKLDKKFRLEFNYNSNHIEGNTLTYGETVLYLIFDKTAGEHAGREYEEMKASDVALKLVQEFAAEKERPLNETFIKNLNGIILVRPYWANAITPDGQGTRRLITTGDYKKHPNSVRLQNGEMFHYASPQETPSLMTDLLQWYRKETEENTLHPVEIAALFHYKLVRIHPFDDGNGRISRLLMNYVLYHYNFPPVIIKSINKKEYLFALNRADSGDINAFVSYVAQQMIWSLDISIKAAKGESIEESDDVEKEISLWKNELNNKKPINAIPKSGDVLLKLYSEALRPFLIRFQNKLHKNFNDLFNNWEVTESVNNRREKSTYIEYRINGGPEYENSEPTNIESIYSIGLDIYMSGFTKNEKSDINPNIKLDILFNSNNYQINIATPLGKISYLDGGSIYNHIITEQEQELLINNAIKLIFTYIKEHTEV